MRKLVFVITLLPFLAIAQKRTLTIAPTYSMLPDTYLGKAGGIHVAGLQQVVKGFYAGLSVDALGLTGVIGPYFPIAANLQWRTSTDPGKLSGMIMAEPGYAAYRYEEKNYGRGSYTVSHKGGATFFGGLGVQSPTKNRVQALLMVGFSSFTVIQESYRGKDHYTLSGPSIRLGIVVH